MLHELLTAHEYMAVVETLEEEIALCEQMAERDGVEYDETRGPLLESAIRKLAPERANGEDADR